MAKKYKERTNPSLTRESLCEGDAYQPSADLIKLRTTANYK